MRAPAAVLILLVIVTPAWAADATCSLNVTVVDEAGKPAPAGIEVQAVSERGVSFHRTLIGGGTPAVFEGLDCGAWTVSAGWDPGYSRSQLIFPWTSSAVILTPGIATPVTLTIPVVRKVRARVEDEEGRPLAQGHVRAGGIGTSFGATRGEFLTLDANGEAEFLLRPGPYQMSYLSDSGQRVVETRVDGARTAPDPVIGVLEGPLRILFRVAGGLRINGEVRDTDGLGVDGVYVVVLIDDEPIFEEVRTRDNGRFEILAPSLPATIAAFDTAGEWRIEPERIVVASSTDAQGLAFLARPDDRPKLRGVVVAGDGESPMPGAQVLSSPDCDEDAYGSVVTDNDGRFEAPCPVQCGFRVRVTPPRASGYSRVTWEGTPSDCAEEQVLRLPDRSAVHGTVTDGKKRPVAGLPLRIGLLDTVVTNEQGEYEAVGAMDHEARVLLGPVGENRRNWLLRRAGFRDNGNYDGRLTVGPLEPGERFELDLVAVEGGRVCMTVHDDEGEPVPAKMFALYLPGKDASTRFITEGFRAEKRTDPGRLCIEAVAPGVYHALAGLTLPEFGPAWLEPDFIPAWWPGEEDRDYTVAVEVEAGKTLDLGPMVVRPAGKLFLRVAEFEVPSDTPLVVEMLPVSEEEDEEEQPAWERARDEWVAAVEDSDEPIAVAPFPAGRWQIRLCAGEKGCKGDRIWCSEEPVLVESGQTVKPELGPCEVASPEEP